MYGITQRSCLLAWVFLSYQRLPRGGGQHQPPYMSLFYPMQPQQAGSRLGELMRAPIRCPKGLTFQALARPSQGYLGAGAPLGAPPKEFVWSSQVPTIFLWPWKRQWQAQKGLMGSVARWPVSFLAQALPWASWWHSVKALTRIFALLLTTTKCRVSIPFFILLGMHAWGKHLLARLTWPIYVDTVYVCT